MAPDVVPAAGPAQDAGPHAAQDADPGPGAPQGPEPRPLPASVTGLGRTLVMGVVNVTPDSFSDGGEWFAPDAAVAHGLELVAAGADLVDVGGESTSPGAPRVTPEVELARVLPVIRALSAEGAVVSVDTTRAVVAEQALAAGAAIVNDVSGGLADPAMGRVVAESGAVYVAMHWRGPADVMDSLATYDDVVLDVRDELAARLDALVGQGVRPEQVVLDPGLGFSKPGSDNWPLLAHLDVLAALGRPVLVGASRKRFLGHLLAGSSDAPPVPPLGRDAATAAITTLCAAAGAWCVRVHDVRPSADAVRVVARWRQDVRASRTGRPDRPPAAPSRGDGPADAAASAAEGRRA